MTKLTNRLVSACLVLSFTVQVIAQEPAPNLRSSALRLIDGLDNDSMATLYARQSIVVWFCEQRKYDQAVEQITKLPLDEKLELVTIIAKSAVDARENVTAEKILSTALSILTKHGDDEAFDREASDFAELAVRNGNFEMASKFVSILDPGTVKKSRALLTLARARAGSNNPKAAVTLVEEALAQTPGFDEDEQKEVIGITVEAAHILASAGELDGAKNLAATANATLLSQTKPDSEAQTAVASLFGALGNLSQAVGMVDSLDADSKMPALATLSLSCTDPEMARTLLEKSRDLILAIKRDFYFQSSKLRDLVSAYLKAGHTEETLELLPKIKDPYYLHTSAIEVAKALRKSGRIDEAEAALDIATKVAQAILSERSEDIPGYASTSRAKSKSQILITLVENYISIDKLERAEVAAKSIDHPQYESSAISRVALAYAKKKERFKAQSLFNRALALSSTAREYRHDRAREDGLFNTALALNEAGFLKEASIAIRRFLEEVKKNDSLDQYVGHLFILGDVAESNGVIMSPRSQALLRQLENN